MNDRTLRTRIARLAQAHPEFRKDLLPLLKKGGAFGYTEVVVPVEIKVSVIVPLTVSLSPEGDVAGYQSPTIQGIRDVVLQDRHSVVTYEPPSIKAVAKEYLLMRSR
jgi:hypothetical protein